MKKYLLLFSMMAIVQLGYASSMPSPDHKVASDSVVIEFGKSGRIVILVDSKEDFEKLKLMNINQIIRELDLEENEESGETTIVEIKRKDGSSKQVVKVTEDGAETEVYIGNMRLLVDETGENTKVRFEPGVKKNSDPPFITYFNLDLGVNNYLEDGKFPTSDKPYAVKGWGSWEVGLNFMASQRISKGFYWNFGLGFQFYNFKFENRDFQAVKGDDTIDFIQRLDVDGSKSKISASYLTAMTLLELDFGKMNDNGRQGVRLAAGPYAGYRLGGQSKYVYRELDGSNRSKDKQDTGLYLQNFRYGIRGELGIGRVTFFTTYDLNELFQEGKGPELNPITFGIVF
ncbi:outer membrane protein with beta-barrel domain [Algoriphagus ratkowskyi]|uniref:Outer membrane beta-barrel protein n=1 Tax=Algoriphagus ratkowskyi TaxID=57028 RepID=A0A2W7RJI2_9BACT|nr:outer membrane beta-barrel protein [Algoriphagus ratkowskyi]PZX61028.1 outer membrane protein with beta-barrel domain [Algoriphagus ratkowskyi]TXD79166.1 outer membrane beta-barrel protein [Algoriphagus ratkowskyi]